MLDIGPAEILAAMRSNIDLFPCAADIVEEQMPAARLHREAKNIAAPGRPDGPVLSLGLRIKRIVGRNATVRIDTENFPEESVEVLRGCVGGLVADGNIEFAIKPKVQRPTLVAILDGPRHL